MLLKDSLSSFNKLESKCFDINYVIIKIVSPVFNVYLFDISNL